MDIKGTCTITTLSTDLRSPTIMEAMAIMAGPARNFSTNALTAVRAPQAIMLALDAMKRPIKYGLPHKLEKII